MSEPLWEDVGNGDFRRTKAPGGWLYEHWRYSPKNNDWEAYAVVFVPALQGGNDDNQTRN